MANNRRPTFVFPIVLIAIGAIFLYANYHPGFEPWPILRTYWPLLLILVGLAKIWDSTQRRRAGNPNGPSAPRPSIEGTIAILAIVFVVFALFWHGRVFSRDRRADTTNHHETRTVDRDDARSVDVTVESGAGTVTVNGGADHLLEADFDYGSSYSAPQVDYRIESGVGHLNITQNGEHTHFGTSHNDWDLHLSDKVPLELKVEMGAGDGRFHLRDVQLTNLNLQMGAGRVDVDLTGDRKQDLNADIEGGVGQATIHLPRNVGVIASASGGIGAVTARGLNHDGDDYVNDVYGKTPATIRLRVQGGVGHVNLLLEP